jgi:hypothetical protein
MGTRTALLPAALVAGAAACTPASSSPDAGSPDPLAGTWQCTTTNNLTVTMPPGVHPAQSMTSATVAVVDNGDGTITATRTNDAGANCVMRSTVSGSKATLQSGQTCAFGTLTLTFTGGSSNAMGNALVSSRSYTFSGMLTYTPDAGASQTISVSGAGNSTDSCTKQ